MGTLLVAAVLAALTSTPRPLATEIEGATVGLAIAERRETRINGWHMALAASPAGEIVGALIDRRGRTRCIFRGTNDGTCVRIVGCGTSGEVCR